MAGASFRSKNRQRRGLPRDERHLAPPDLDRDDVDDADEIDDVESSPVAPASNSADPSPFGSTGGGPLKTTDNELFSKLKFAGVVFVLMVLLKFGLGW